MLEKLFEHMELEVPWTYKAARCVRTVFELSKLDPETVPKDDLLEHVALDDVLWQVRAVQMGIAKMGVSQPTLE